MPQAREIERTCKTRHELMENVNYKMTGRQEM